MKRFVFFALVLKLFNALVDVTVENLAISCLNFLKLFI